MSKDIAGHGGRVNYYTGAGVNGLRPDLAQQFDDALALFGSSLENLDNAIANADDEAGKLRTATALLEQVSAFAQRLIGTALAGRNWNQGAGIEQASRGLRDSLVSAMLSGGANGNAVEDVIKSILAKRG